MKPPLQARAIAPRDMPAPTFTHPDLGIVGEDLESTNLTGDDEAVTGGTVRIMAQLAIRDAAAPIVQQAAQAALAAHQLTPGKDTDSAVFTAVWKHVKERVRYTGDEQIIEPFDFYFPPDELLIPPRELLAMQRPLDDCDGFSMVIASMLWSLGYRNIAYKTIAANRSYPQNYSHVYPVAWTREGAEYPLDASHGPAPGVEYAEQYKSRLWPIGADMIQPAGLGAIDWTQILQTGSDLAKGILIPRYGNPPPGTVRGPGGVISTLPDGAMNVAGQAISGSTLLIGGAALLAVLMLARK